MNSKKHKKKINTKLLLLHFIVACGGMDNMCTVYDVNNLDTNGAAKMLRELAGYDGFLSSCKFLDDKTILTGSGDMKM